jgi:hypothetical protein
MNEIQRLIPRIEGKLRQLVEDKRALEKQNEVLRSQIEQKDKVALEQQEIIDNLKQQVKVLKLGEAIKSNSDKTEVKLRINDLVRKIDRIIKEITSLETKTEN